MEVENVLHVKKQKKVKWGMTAFKVEQKIGVSCNNNITYILTNEIVFEILQIMATVRTSL